MAVVGGDSSGLSAAGRSYSNIAKDLSGTASSASSAIKQVGDAGNEQVGEALSRFSSAAGGSLLVHSLDTATLGHAAVAQGDLLDTVLGTS